MQYTAHVCIYYNIYIYLHIYMYIYIHRVTCVQFVCCFFEASIPYVVSGDQLLVGARLGTDFARALQDQAARRGDTGPAGRR